MYRWRVEQYRTVDFCIEVEVEAETRAEALELGRAEIEDFSLYDWNIDDDYLEDPEAILLDKIPDPPTGPINHPVLPGIFPLTNTERVCD